MLCITWTIQASYSYMTRAALVCCTVYSESANVNMNVIKRNAELSRCSLRRSYPPPHLQDTGRIPKIPTTIEQLLTLFVSCQLLEVGS